MQAVGKFQAVARADGELAAAAVATIEAWASTKFEQDETGYSVVKRSGVEALFDKSEDEFDRNRLTTFEVLEPIPGGQLQTTARVLTSAEQVRLNCTLSIGAEGGLAPPQIELHAPRFIREIIGTEGRWQFSPNVENLISRFINIGRDDVDQFLSLLQSRLRRLPLIVVSEFDGRTIAGDMHTRAAADLCGLGHTCRLSEEASWEITRRLGREWSTYNGAVRLFWPFRANSENPWNHPLWTYDWLTRRGESEQEIRDWLRRQLRDRLLDASTFLADDPAFGVFARGLERTRRDQAHRTAAPVPDHAAEEIRALRVELDAKDEEIETLRNNVEALTIALRSQHAPSADQAQVEQAPPTTVADALAAARRAYSGRVAFGENLDEQIAELNPGAGPPEKVLRYLSSLADLSSALEAGSLGRSVPTWLQEAGVDASGESETTKKNRDSQRARTFRFGSEEIYCEYHAKPSDGVSPDKCVRIYFAVADTAPRVRVGYIGRHFD
ncbi:MAG: hypothetical protein ACHP7N_15280 [Caulobacterales bacterium]